MSRVQIMSSLPINHGLDEVMAGELVEFQEDTIDIALNLESTNVGVVLMGDGLLIQEGSSVKATGRIAQIPVSEGYLGRVINALAKPIDGRDSGCDMVPKDEPDMDSWWTDTLCSQYSFLRNSVALFILWEVWKDRNSIIHDNVKLNIVKTRQKIWKWLLDTMVLFHPAGFT
ncbi:hypothetical protein R6Q57_011735 [Mikania cordata]